MYCRQCGAQVDDNAKFCRYCGATIKDTNVFNSNENSSYSNEDSYNNESVYNSNSSWNNSNNNDNYRRPNNNYGYQPVYQPESTTLSVCALVFAFLISLVGIILGIVGLSKCHEKANKDRCTAAIIIGIISIILGVFLQLS